MMLLKNISIRTKLFLISMIPTLGLIVLLADSISNALQRKEDALQVDRAAERVERLSNLLHGLQMERAYFLSYQASESADDMERITEQLAETNKVLMEIKALYRSQNTWSPMFATLDSLSVWRDDVDRYPLRANEAKALIMDEIFNITRAGRDPEIRSLLEAHLLLLYTKEYFSRARNLLFPFFITGGLSDSLRTLYTSRVGQYEHNHTRFLVAADAELRDHYLQNWNNATSVAVHDVLTDVFTQQPESARVLTRDWWNLSGSVANFQAETERLSLRKIRQYSRTQLDAVNRSIAASAVGGTATLAVMSFLLVYTIRQILKGLRGIKTAAQKLADGEVDFVVDVHTHDEIGDLAESFNRMVAIQKSYAEVAEKIGAGDYDTPVLVRTPADILGVSLNTMKDNLHRLSRENERRTWLLTSTNLLNDKMRGEKDLPVLANDVIGQLAESLNAQIGALYVRDNGYIRRMGTYAFNGGDTKDRFFPGEGLVGQVALSGKQILFRDIPDDYPTINSGLVEVRPRNVVVFPFSYEKEVKGVLELGTSGKFAELDIELLQLVATHIGIAVHAAQSRERLKQLLEETQRQSEELESQQEELKQFNEELLEKTRLLERSEEELKAQQEELQLSNEELAEKATMLEEQKQNLEYTKLQLEAKAHELELASRYKSEFLSNMSHELRTPLNSILILAQVLMENRNNTLAPKEIKYANTIYNSGNDLLELIDEILDLARIEAGRMDLDVQPFAIESLTQNLLGTFEELARSKKQKFSIRVSPAFKEKVIVSDARRVEQILKNFLSNSCKFTPPGGTIQLLVERPADDVHFTRESLVNAGDIVALRVLDSGIGIPAEKLATIFEAFQQVDGSTKRKYGGTGLGLSISRELAYLLGGEIHVSSEEGKGCNFTLYLPTQASAKLFAEDDSALRVDAEAPEFDSTTRRADPFIDASHYDDQHLISEGDRTILIMEDDVEFAKVLLDFVHERDYKGIIAHQGNTGLSYARHYKPDAIILDMRLPVVDGEEVLRRLKADPELRHIPVQIISGYDYRRSSLELGALDYIRKPVTRDAFGQALDKVERFVSRKPKRLLIIEDDIKHNEAVKELIGNGDVKCYSAFSGNEAYEMLLKTTFDCIIIDLGLPDIPGLQFLEKIRAHENLNRIPVIVYTGKDLSRDESRQLEKLANTVVLKTAFSKERLLDETTLFLHRVESKLPREKQRIIRKLHKSDEVLRNKRVLIVDDDDRNVYALLSALEAEGVVCSTAANGREALASIDETNVFDLILMDVMMPEMDGFEATRAIRRLSAYEKIPIIALTAKAMKNDRQKCLVAGMSDYISKPLNVQQLLSLMRVWLYV